MRITSFEHSVARVLRPMRLDRIKHKIVAFALLATLIPSATTAWLSYTQNRAALTEKIVEGLQRASRQAARETDLWLKDRIYELRVFGASYEVSEILDRGRGAAGRLTDYLRSVKAKVDDYGELQAWSVDGRLVATTAATPHQLPDEWLADIRQDKPVLGRPVWDSTLGRPIVALAVPVAAGGGRVVGALTTTVSLGSVERILAGAAPTGTGTMLLTQPSGLLITTDVGLRGELRGHVVPEAILEQLQTGDGTVASYEGLGGEPVLGAMSAAPQLGWSVIAELPERDAYAPIHRLRSITMLTVAALLVGVGLLAYLLGLLIVRPLTRLTQGAGQVADGNLGVDLPVVGGGELSYLTEIFNGMVERLRENKHELDERAELLRRQNAELERLSITDGLTGLYNRRHLMQTLDKETLRARRHEYSYAVVMLDVDHFKQYNDSCGHLAGDDVLTGIAALLRECIREVDYPARYGGEEFLVMLPETDLEEAVRVAERIRERVQTGFAGDPERRPVTTSVGVAEFPIHGTNPEAVISAADEALYAAKQQGRNRVVAAKRGPRRAVKKA
ncbi:MAG: diguanylate cyclase [Gemmatimonadota bacterium]|nr:diguanylate cyclase [Gemmatimonadota bacterium]